VDLLAGDLTFRFASREVVWHQMAWYAMVAGVIGAILAAIPCLIDFFSITDPRAGKVRMTHPVLNAALVVLYSVNVWIRTVLGPDAALPLLLSVVGWRDWW